MLPEAPAEVLLAEGTSFEGLLVLTGRARIDGRHRGEVLATELVWVGPDGAVEADLEADTVVVEGRVDGDLRGHRLVVLGPGAVVRGDLRAGALSIAEGARVDGSCHCGVVPPEGPTGSEAASAPS